MPGLIHPLIPLDHDRQPYDQVLVGIRHGPTSVTRLENNLGPEERIATGRNYFSELTRRGIVDSLKLGWWLKEMNLPISCIWSSDTIRTQQTAAMICEGMGRMWPDYKVSSRITELSQGKWEGCRDAVVRTPDVWEQIEEEGWNFVPGEGTGESQAAVFARAWGFLRDEVLCRPKMISLVVTHGNVLACLLTGLLGLDRNQVHTIELAPTSMTIVTFRDGEIMCADRNLTPHLKEYNGIE